MISTKITFSEIVHSPEIRAMVARSAMTERLHTPFYDSLIRDPDGEFAAKLEEELCSHRPLWRVRRKLWAAVQRQWKSI